MKLRAYLFTIRNVIMTLLAYRAHFFFTLIGKALYIFMSFFLWKAIYASNELINNLNFQQAYLYVGLSTCLSSLFHTTTDWHLANDISRGNILHYLVRPLNLRHEYLTEALGTAFLNFLIIVIPSLIIIRCLLGLFVFNHILFFLLSVLFSFLLKFYLDYIIGLIAFYTQSLNGIVLAKESVISILSGALIPLSFFPEKARIIFKYLPFQALYNIPIRVLIEKNISITEIAFLLVIQIFWIFAFFVFSTFFYKNAVRNLTINGG